MYLRIAIVVAEEHRNEIELTLRRMVGDAIRVISISHSIEEARIRAALIGPDIIVVGSEFGVEPIVGMIRPESSLSPMVIAWSREPEEFLEGASQLAGRIGPQTPREAVVALFESCAHTITERKSIRSSVFRHPETSYKPDIIALPHQHGIDVRPVESIIHVKGEGNYTQVTFDKGGDILMSRTIGDYEDVLPPATFLRVHRSHIINIHHVRKIIRGKVMRVLLSNGEEVEVSDGKRDALLGMINIVRRRT